MDISTITHKDYVIEISDTIFYRNSIFANEQMKLDCMTVMLRNYDIITIMQQDYVTGRVPIFYVS